MKPNLKTVASIFKGLQKVSKDHASEILTGLGIGGMITTAVLAAKVTPKAMAKIAEKEVEEERNLNTLEKVQTAWTCYVPPVLLGSASVICLVSSTSINVRRNAALAAACSLAENTLKEYTEKTVEVVGEKKEQSIRDAIAKDRMEKDPVIDKEVIITPVGDTLCYDLTSGRYFKSDMETVRKVVNDLNKRMRNEMFISLNDYYYELGLPPLNPLGEAIGWNIQRGDITPSFGSHLAKDGRPALAIAHTVPPQYGFDILSMN